MSWFERVALTVASKKVRRQWQKNLKISLAARVGDASTLFRKKQAAYLKKMRSIGGLHSPSPGTSTPVQNPFTDPSLIESESDRTYSHATLQQAVQQRLLYDNNAVIDQREREIEEIAQGIIELSNIFQELQTMVIDQGSLLDRIDYNVEKTATEVKAADKELTVATDYQKRSVKRKIMLLLIIIILGMFILLGLKLGSKSRNSQPPPPPVNPPLNEAPENPTRRFWDIGRSAEAIQFLKRDWRRRRRRDLIVT